MKTSSPPTILHILDDKNLADTAALQLTLESSAQKDLYLRLMPHAVTVATTDARAQIVPTLTLRGVTSTLHISAICRRMLVDASTHGDPHRMAIAVEFLAELDAAVRSQLPGPYRLTAKLAELGLIPSVALVFQGQACVAYPRHIFRSGRNHYLRPIPAVTILLAHGGPERVPEAVADGMTFEPVFAADLGCLDAEALDILGRAGQVTQLVAPELNAAAKIVELITTWER